MSVARTERHITDDYKKYRQGIFNNLLLSKQSQPIFTFWYIFNVTSNQIQKLKGGVKSCEPCQPNKPVDAITMGSVLTTTPLTHLTNCPHDAMLLCHLWWNHSPQSLARTKMRVCSVVQYTSCNIWNICNIYPGPWFFARGRQKIGLSCTKQLCSHLAQMVCYHSRGRNPAKEA